MQNVKYVSAQEFALKVLEFDEYNVLRHPQYRDMYFVSMWVDDCTRWVLSVDVCPLNESPELVTMLFDSYSNAWDYAEKIIEYYKCGL